MEKFVPFEKLSKKKQRELNAKSRRSWNGICPVTRKPENPKAYNRKKTQHRSDFDTASFLFFRTENTPLFQESGVFSFHGINYLDAFFGKAFEVAFLAF